MDTLLFLHTVKGTKPDPQRQGLPPLPLIICPGVVIGGEWQREEKRTWRHQWGSRTPCRSSSQGRKTPPSDDVTPPSPAHPGTYTDCILPLYILWPHSSLNHCLELYQEIFASIPDLYHPSIPSGWPPLGSLPLTLAVYLGYPSNER